MAISIYLFIFSWKIWKLVWSRVKGSMLGDGLKKTLPKQGRNPRKIRGLLSIFLTPLDGCFRCSTPFFAYWGCHRGRNQLLERWSLAKNGQKLAFGRRHLLLRIVIHNSCVSKWALTWRYCNTEQTRGMTWINPVFTPCPKNQSNRRSILKDGVPVFLVRQLYFDLRIYNKNAHK